MTKLGNDLKLAHPEVISRRFGFVIFDLVGDKTKKQAHYFITN